MDKLLYRVEEACIVTGLGRTKLYDEIAKRRIGVVHFGKSVRIPADELRAYVDRAKAEAGLVTISGYGFARGDRRQTRVTSGATERGSGSTGTRGERRR